MAKSRRKPPVGTFGPKSRASGTEGSFIRWREGFDVIEPDINAESVHVFPFDPVFPVVVNWHVFRGNRPGRPNRHDYFEILILLSGTMKGQVQGKPVHLRAGDIFLVGSTHYHLLYSSGKSARTVGLGFLRELICKSWTDDKIELLKPFFLEESGGPCVIRGQPQLVDNLTRLMTLIGQAGPAKSLRDRVLVRARVEMILAELVDHLGPVLDGVSVTDGLSRIERLRPLFKELDRDLAQSLSIRRAAALVGMSRSTFVREFRRVVGQTFSTYLTRCRVARAQHLLVATDSTIAEVAQNLGFTDQSYFSRVFRRLVGNTPQVFRRSQGKRTRPPLTADYR